MINSAGFAAIPCVMALALSACAHRAPSEPAAPAMATPDLNADPGYDAAPDKPPAGENTPEPSTPARQSADLAGHLRDDAPARYVVQPGDTLWDIAGLYLDAPWYWRQLWQRNPQIDNPDRIYPGDVLTLVRGMDGRPRLSRAHRTVRLSPRVRVQPADDAIPTIPADAIQSFLGSPRRVAIDTLAQAPYVVSLGDNRIVGGTDVTLYVRGLPADGPRQYALVRAGEVYREPDSHRALGQAAVPIGDIVIEDDRPGEDQDAVAKARLVRAKREARPGDRLLPQTAPDLIHGFTPRAPAAAVTGEIVSVVAPVTQIGQYDVVALAQQEGPALARGDVLDVRRAGRRVTDPVAGGLVQLPGQTVGRVMVFKTAGDISYALVMRARQAIHIGDTVHAPGNT